MFSVAQKQTLLRRFPWIVLGIVTAIGIIGLVKIARDPYMSGALYVEVTYPAAPLIDVSRPLEKRREFRLQIIEFMDYECPPCRAFAKKLEALEENPQVEIRIANFPLSIHKTAMPFAKAMLTVPDDQFRFIHKQFLEIKLFDAQIRVLKLDQDFKKKSVADRQLIENRIKSGLRAAETYNVNSTPTAFIYRHIDNKLFKVIDLSKLSEVVAVLSK